MEITWRTQLAETTRSWGASLGFSVKPPSLEYIYAELQRQTWTVHDKTHVFYTNPHYTAILYAANKGESLNNTDYITINETAGGAWLTKTAIKWNFPKELRDKLWDAGSRNFAMSASGPVVALVFGDNDRPLFVWPERMLDESDLDWKARQATSGPLYQETKNMLSQFRHRSSVWQNIELPLLLTNPNVTTINNVSRVKLNEYKSSSPSLDLALARISRDLGHALLYPRTSPLPPGSYSPPSSSSEPHGGGSGSNALSGNLPLLNAYSHTSKSRTTTQPTFFQGQNLTLTYENAVNTTS